MHLRVDLGGRRIIKKIFFKQKTAYEIVARDWSSDVCSSDLPDLSAIIKDANTAKAISDAAALAGVDRKSVV